MSPRSIPFSPLVGWLSVLCIAGSIRLTFFPPPGTIELLVWALSLTAAPLTQLVLFRTAAPAPVPEALHRIELRKLVDRLQTAPEVPDAD